MGEFRLLILSVAETRVISNILDSMSIDNVIEFVWVRYSGF